MSLIISGLTNLLNIKSILIKCNFTNHFLYLLHRHLAFSASFLSKGPKEILQVHPSDAFCATSSGTNGVVPANLHWVAPD